MSHSCRRFHAAHARFDDKPAADMPMISGQRFRLSRRRPHDMTSARICEYARVRRLVSGVFFTDRAPAFTPEIIAMQHFYAGDAACRRRRVPARHQAAYRRRARRGAATMTMLKRAISLGTAPSSIRDAAAASLRPRYSARRALMRAAL